MNFTYLYKDDPDMDMLYGNITWIVPNNDIPAHWIHAEYICKLNRSIKEQIMSLIYRIGV